MKTKILLLILLHSVESWAQPIVITTQNLTQSESTARISASNGTSYSDHILQQLRERARDQKLLHWAARLRRAELENNPDKAYSLCQHIFKIRHDADWSPKDRAFIHRCIQKLALMSPDSRKSLGLKHESNSFSDKEQELEPLSNQLIQNYKWILINGRAFATAQRKLEVPQSYFRMTLISDRNQAITKVINREQLQRWSHKTQPLVSGDCKSGYRYESRHLDSQSLAKTIVADRHCKVPILSSHPVQNTFVKSNSASFKIPTWAWWMVGGFVGYAVYDNNKETGGSRRSSKRGF